MIPPHTPCEEQRALEAAALLLIHEGATPSDLAVRFKSLQSAAERAGTAAILARLAQHGLVCRATTGGENARYVLTSLGRQYADASFECSPELTTRLEELERLRSDLLATIAHELRTPLTAVRTCVGLLLDPAVELDAGTREHLLRSIEQSADRMQQLVSDVLDLTRLRAGKVQLQLRRFDARTLARDAAASLEPLLQHRGQQLKLEQPNTAIWVYGDRRRLERALLNLLSNAHKFSPRGGAVRLSVEEADGQVVWTVRDRGPGIAAADQAKLFERFFVGRGDASAPTTGTGLGLPIALAVARAHDGTIAVESALGRGSTFTLRVPARGPAGGDAE